MKFNHSNPLNLECGTLCGCVFFGVFHQFLLISTKSYNQVQTPSQIASDHVKAWSKSLFSHVYNENHMFFLQPFNALGMYKITYAQSQSKMARSIQHAPNSDHPHSHSINSGSDARTYDNHFFVHLCLCQQILSELAIAMYM